MKNTYIIIILIFCISCRNTDVKRPENVNEEVTVILNTFENGIVWVSKNDFKDMYLQTKNLPNKVVERRRKYTITDSLFSIRKFKTSLFDKIGENVKKTCAFQFVPVKSANPNGFEIIRMDKAIARSDYDYNGNLTFSRVIFNHKRNRAKYYFEQSILFSAQRGWGMGTYIYAKKINSIWIFDKKELVWIV